MRYWFEWYVLASMSDDLTHFMFLNTTILITLFLICESASKRGCSIWNWDSKQVYVLALLLSHLLDTWYIIVIRRSCRRSVERKRAQEWILSCNEVWTMYVGRSMFDGISLCGTVTNIWIMMFAINHTDIMHRSSLSNKFCWASLWVLILEWMHWLRSTNVSNASIVCLWYWFILVCNSECI